MIIGNVRKKYIDFMCLGSFIQKYMLNYFFISILSPWDLEMGLGELLASLYNLFMLQFKDKM